MRVAYLAKILIFYGILMFITSLPSPLNPRSSVSYHGYTVSLQREVVSSSTTSLGLYATSVQYIGRWTPYLEAVRINDIYIICSYLQEPG
jgi:hypothetical protein